MASNATGITYSLDAASISGGNTINSTTGQVTYNVNWVNSTTITASAAGCYGPQTATHTVSTTPTVGLPVFTTGSSSTICQASTPTTYTANATTTTGITYSINTTGSGNSIDAVTGQVTWSPAYSGNTIVTASAAGCNGPRTATHTVTVTASVGTPVFTLGASSTRCQAAGNVTYNATATTNTGITYALDATSLGAGNTINTNTGQVTYLAGWFGTSTITATATGCNGPTVNSHTVTINRLVTTPVFGLGATSTICQASSPVTYTATANYQTSITYTLDGTSVSNGNSINSATGQVTYAAGWFGSSTITATANGCSPLSASHTVTITRSVGTPVFTLGATSTRCRAAATVTYSATAISNTGITYSLDAASLSAGNTIVAGTGAVTYTSSYTGTAVITATATGCNGPRSANHTVTITPDVTTPVFNPSLSLTRCIKGEKIFYTATASNATGNITYSLDAASVSAGNSIVATTGELEWSSSWFGNTTITARANGCNGPAFGAIIITTNDKNTSPVFAMGSTSIICQASAPITYSASMYAALSYAYTLDDNSLAAGCAIDAVTGRVTYAPGWAGTTTITARSYGCDGEKKTDHKVTVVPSVTTPVFKIGGPTSTRCIKAETVTYDVDVDNETSIVYSLDNASISAGLSIVSSSGRVTFPAAYTGTAYITATAYGCNGPITAVHTATTVGGLGATVFDMGSSSSRCQGSGPVTYNAAANNSFTIVYVLDNTSRSGGNTIVAATGVITWAAGWSGNSTITATASGCGSNTVATHTVTTIPSVQTPVFSVGASSSRCSGSGNVTYTATAANNTGITYSLDGASLSAGNTINTATGRVVYTSGYYGVSYITVTATGCNGPVNATHTATVNGPLGAGSFDMGTNSARCQPGGGGSTNVQYTANAEYATGVTYSLDLVSRLAGNSINAATGVVTYSNGYNGTSTITAVITGCTSSTTVNHTAVTNGIVGTPVFSAGSTSTRCQGGNTVTYAVTAANTNDFTFTIDAASLAGGNTINATTGALTYAATWSGTTVITVNANGCSGPKSATHTVTITPSVGVPVFSMGTSSTRCIQGGNGGRVTYTATAFSSTSVTYALDNASVSAGNVIDANGRITYTGSYFGASIITATANGCNGPTTASHTATTYQNVTTPVFTLGSLVEPLPGCRFAHLYGFFG